MAAITAAAQTRFGRDQDPATMVRQVASELLDRSGLETVDALVVANAGAEGFCGIANVATWTATEAGLVDATAVRVETGPSSGLAALRVGEALVRAGSAQRVMVLGWEAMTGVPTDEATRVLAQYMDPTEQALDLSLPGLVALLTSAYLARFEVTPEQLARVPVKAHRLALDNPDAQFHKAITVDDVLASRVVADPLRLYHCAPMSDGAAGVVLEGAGPVELAATAGATDHLGYAHRHSPPERFRATRVAAPRLEEAWGRSLTEVDVVELHDAFSVLEAVNLEDLGLAPEGQGLARLGLEDPFSVSPVVNPSGGLKAKGHPVGATGLGQVVEVVRQLKGEAPNQVEQARTGLVHNIGGFGNNVHVALLVGSP